MILENKFLYIRVLETDGRITKELTFAGSALVMIGIMILAVAAALMLFPVLTFLGIRA